MLFIFLSLIFLLVKLPFLLLLEYIIIEALFIVLEDIPALLKRAVKAASASELKRYEDWTKEFGEEGV